MYLKQNLTGLQGENGKTTNSWLPLNYNKLCEGRHLKALLTVYSKGLERQVLG